jgi:hypothetical protein
MTINPNTGKKIADSLPDEPEWERPGDSARAGGVARSTIYNAIARGQLDARKFNGCTLINVASRRALFNNLPKAQIAQPKLKSKTAEAQANSAP